MVLRYALLSATLLAACLAAGSRLLVREPADPCVATPEIHACAVFLQPDWLVRRAQAARLMTAPAVHGAVPVATATVTTDTLTTGAITVSDGTTALSVAGAAQEAGL